MHRLPKGLRVLRERLQEHLDQRALERAEVDRLRKRIKDGESIEALRRVGPDELVVRALVAEAGTKGSEKFAMELVEAAQEIDPSDLHARRARARLPVRTGPNVFVKISDKEDEPWDPVPTLERAEKLVAGSSPSADNIDRAYALFWGVFSVMETFTEYSDRAYDGLERCRVLRGEPSSVERIMGGDTNSSGDYHKARQTYTRGGKSVTRQNPYAGKPKKGYSSGRASERW